MVMFMVIFYFFCSPRLPFAQKPENRADPRCYRQTSGWTVLPDPSRSDDSTHATISSGCQL